MQRSEIIHCFSSSALVAIMFIVSCSIFLPTEANYVSFSTELIHRDSPRSPLFNPNLTIFDRLEAEVQRSLVGSSSLIPDVVSYLMKISYGRPPVEFFQLVDTGSEITWIQCEPCTHCFPSEYAPFNPRISRTFQFVKCSSNRPCPYEIEYEDDSYSRGVYARDTITLGSGSQRVSFDSFLFGCGHENVGEFPFKGAGIVGLRPKDDSFINQLSALHHGKFSICMAPPRSSPGRISFGDEAVVSGPGVVTTPLILDSHYYVMLDGISVGTEKLKYVPDHRQTDHHLSSNDSTKVVNGGKIIIDSGTNVMFLPPPFQKNVHRLVQKHIKLNPLPNMTKPFTLCYPPSLRDADIPKITVHFPGANLELSPLNTFVGTSQMRCLAIVPTRLENIYGNLAKMNFLVVFNLIEKKVSFKKTDCSNLRL